MTLTLTYKHIKFAENISTEILASKIKNPGGYGDLQAFITHSSELHSFLCPHF